MGEVKFMEFFLGLDKTVQVAIIGLISAVSVAIITGIFSWLSNRKKSKEQAPTTQSNKTSIKQSSSGHNNTFIGIQNNGKDDN